MKLYGIKTCSTVGKARKFLKEHDIEYEMIDFKTTQVDESKIKEWLTKVDIDILFNKKGKKYRDLKLKELNLDYDDKIKWMAKENYLIKRPVIELDDSRVIVGYDEDEYRQIFL